MSINKVAVMGAGVMGSGIAAQVANAGVDVLLLDIVSEQGSPNALAEKALEKLQKSEPHALMHKRNVRHIHCGNLQDDLQRLKDMDWVIEAVVEKPDIKRGLYHQLQQVCSAQCIFSSNTSTLPLHVLAAGFPEDFSRRFMITHFFNPPRYMRLLELVVPEQFDPTLLTELTAFADVRLGKGCVFCKDTPGFIANRIGTFWIQTAVQQAVKFELSIEQCDAAMRLFGIPKTGVFGLLDLVGLDVMPLVLQSFKRTLPAEDKLAAIVENPPILDMLLAQGMTGRKGRGGFYRLLKTAGNKVKQGVDLVSGDYRDSHRQRIEGVDSSASSIRDFLLQDNALSHYCWKLWSDTLCYAADIHVQIADNIESIDTAMRLGYNWKFGPFEMIEYLGADWFLQQLVQHQHEIPALLADGHPLYQQIDSQLLMKQAHGQYRPIKRAEGVLLLRDIRRKSTPLRKTPSASLWDIGDGCLCLEFHSKMNTLDTRILTLISESIELCTSQYQALVIYNEGENFSAGANLSLLMPEIKNHELDTMGDILRAGQQAFQALKYAPFPVLGAPSGLALGGGCEILLHCDAIQAHAEVYMGLVEVGVGLVPAWGGCKELLQRWIRHPKRPGGPLPPIAKCFETIGMATVSKSAQQARQLLFLGQDDGISMNRDRLLADAKARALGMVEGYYPPEPFVYQLPGATARAALAIATHTLQLLGKASAYDVEIGKQLATILSGGETESSGEITEQAMFDLEVEAFLHLIQQQKTLARLEHMLTTGKALRN